MKPDNLEALNRSFAVQASGFESQSLRFAKEDYLHYMISKIAPHSQDRVLEAAAGTCACGRYLAPLAGTVVCLDATAPMLEIGKKKAEQAGLKNMVFIKGYAQELPFLDNSFELVLSRLAFHHFTNPERVFSEMVRVLKPGGKLVMIDMEAPEESLRDTEDEIERLRDPSHVKNLSLAEMQELYLSHGLSIEICEVTEIQQELTNWMALTKTPEETQREIQKRMETDLTGGKKTGFYPYRKDRDICFHQRWRLLVGHSIA